MRLDQATEQPLRAGLSNSYGVVWAAGSCYGSDACRPSTAASIRALTCGGVRNPGSIGAAGWLRALRHALTGSRDPRAAPGPGCT